KNLDWPGADEIAKRLQAMQAMALRGGAANGAAPAAPDAEHQKQLFALQKSLITAQRELEAIKNDRALDAHRLQIDTYKAETDRLKVVNEARRDAMAGAPRAFAP